ncbi:MAG: 50S ribosomal protein L29 [Anaerolineae bacterium]|jgi:large subunit ribosomal protein L29|nr:50S ribosomal protein L29 [Anaerolineae bacterium]
MDIREIVKMTDEQLLAAIEDNREEMYKLRLQKANGDLSNPKLLKANRRDLARLKLVIGQRQAQAGSDNKGK